jgi:hypothetical protein
VGLGFLGYSSAAFTRKIAVCHLSLGSQLMIVRQSGALVLTGDAVYSYSWRTIQNAVAGVLRIRNTIDRLMLLAESARPV